MGQFEGCINSAGGPVRGRVYGGHPLQLQYPQYRYETVQVDNLSEYYWLTQATDYREGVEAMEQQARFLEEVHSIIESTHGR